MIDNVLDFMDVGLCRENNNGIIEESKFSILCSHNYIESLMKHAQ